MIQSHPMDVCIFNKQDADSKVSKYGYDYSVRVITPRIPLNETYFSLDYSEYVACIGCLFGYYIWRVCHCEMFLDGTIKIGSKNTGLSLDNSLHSVRDDNIAAKTWQYFITRVHVLFLLSKCNMIIRWSEPSHGPYWINLIFESPVYIISS